MAYNYTSVKYLDDVDDKWVKDFVKKNLPAVYNSFTEKLQNSLVGEFIKLKEDAKFCHGDQVWVEQKLAYLAEKLQTHGIQETAKREITGLGMVMFKKLSEMKWREPPAREEYLRCNDSDLEKEVEALDSLFRYTKSEQDLLNSGGRRKKRTKRRRKRTRKRRKSRRKSRRRKNLKKRTKRRR